MPARLIQWETLILILFALIIFLAGSITGVFITNKKSIKKLKLSYLENQFSNNAWKKILDESKQDIDSGGTDLENVNQFLSKKIGEYRKQLAGIKRMGFVRKKKRAEILFYLLLENEVLEQLLTKQSEKLPEERRNYLIDQMSDVRKRQQLMAEFFTDGSIKSHVKKLISGDLRLGKETGADRQKFSFNPAVESSQTLKS